MILFLDRYLIGVLKCHQTRKKRYSRLAIIHCTIPIAIVAPFQLRPKKNDSLLRPEKKVPIVITTGKKKVLVVCLAGARSLLGPEKKVLVVCLAGARSLLRPDKKF